MSEQKFPNGKYEIIYVEQRGKKKSNYINHKAGLESLEDKAKEVDGEVNIRLEYVGDEGVFHWGRLVNRGLELAAGEYISAMDGDMLVPSTFLRHLTHFHEENPGSVVNIHRKMGDYPAGVLYYENWTEADYEFESVLRTCSERFDPIPEQTGYIGPLISAHRRYWEEVGGHDPHPLWATPVSGLGGDLVTRLQISTGTERRTLPECYAVHPWHPSGTNSIRDSNQERVEEYFELQEALRKWSVEHSEPHYKPRQSYANELYEEHRELVEWMHGREELVPDGITEVRKGTVLPVLARVKYRQTRSLVSKIMGIS